MSYYVASNDLGDAPERFVALVGAGAQVGVIVNAIDDRADADRATAADVMASQLEQLGLTPVELDLREWFSAADPAPALEGLSGVWVRGGNTFLLRAALGLSGLDAIATRAVRADELVWGGASAGGIVLGPSLRGVELMNDPAVVEATYGVPARWDGLGVFEHVIVPHYRSGHVESDAAEAMVERYQRDGTPHIGLRSGEYLTSAQ